MVQQIEHLRAELEFAVLPKEGQFSVRREVARKSSCTYSPIVLKMKKVLICGLKTRASQSWGMPARKAVGDPTPFPRARC